MSQLPILPILVPFLGAVLSLFVEHRRYGLRTRRIVSWLFLALTLLAVAALAREASEGRVIAYLLGDWPSRLGIALMADRLSAWMLLTVQLLAVPCLLYAGSGWDRRAPHFHALFQFQLTGLNGAFLTGDLFNLFVFFEVLLIASYGLLLSGGRGARMRAGLHYVVINVAASTLFLIALGLLYGLLGTLNMAELGARVAAAPAARLPLIEAAGGLLLLVFCAKAALLPLYLWLPTTYARAPGAVAALFAVMTKVGLYAVLRVCTLVFGGGALAGFAWRWLLPAGLATLVLAAFGVAGTTRLRVQAAYLVVLSAATLFVAFALAQPASIGAGLYYLAHSTFVVAALFLVADGLRSHRQPRGAAAWFLVAAVSVAGLPPLSGFIGKVALLETVPAHWRGWVWGTVLLSSFVVVAGLARVGIQTFWWRCPSVPTRASPAQSASIALLLAYGIGMALAAAPLLRYTQAAATQVLAADDYLHQVRATPSTSRSP